MEISYGEERLDKFDWYAAAPSPDSIPPVAIVFVHGGAWRSEDKADHAQLARSLVQLTNCPVAVPNYRLTTPHDPVRHPAHTSDVLRFLHFLSSWSGPHVPKPYTSAPPSSLILLGHSCSAHILASILLTSPYPDLTPSPQLLAAVRAIVFSEGIYDIDLLLHSFPSYKQWFIANAFGDHESYLDVNVASYPLRPAANHIRWLILHSTGDVLVDQLQSDTMYAHLSALTNTNVSAKVPSVSKSFEALQEGHNELLKGTVYPRIVADFVAAVVADAAAPPESNA